MINQCILCGSNERKKEMSISDHLLSKETFTLVSCSSCGFKYLSDPPAAADAGAYYESEDYIEHSDSAEGFINSIYHKARSFMLPKKYSMFVEDKLPTNILDIGTGTGYFLRYMRERGFDTLGVEISDKARSFGVEKFKLDIRSPEEMLLADFPSGHSYITMWHVLEHVYNANEVMSRLHQLLADDGKVVIALPNNDSPDAAKYKEDWAAYDVPRHLWHFTYATFAAFAEKHGFVVSETKVLPLDPYYNSLISATYKQSTFDKLTAPIFGTYSLLKGLMNHKKASSIVYILKKAS